MVLKEFLNEWNNSSDKILVHTSGSTGKPKPIWVEKQRMKASAEMTCDFLGLKSGDTALLCMPLDYIAGKMVVVRSIIRHLNLIDIKPSGHPLKDIKVPPVFAAMVPMQVYNSMQVANELNILKGIKHLIIGGGSIDDNMASILRDFPNAVWSTYGMTETLSHIALRRLSGDKASEWYTPFNNVSISLNDEGCLIINAPTVCPNLLDTNDRAIIDKDGRKFRIIGRKDNVINSGGIKIQIEEIEKTLKSYISIPYLITKKKDNKFGEIVVMLIKSENSPITTIKEICEKVLPKYYQPRLYIQVDNIPMTETGKPSRAEAIKIAEKASKAI